jgi:hypothetical protein
MIFSYWEMHRGGEPRLSPLIVMAFLGTSVAALLDFRWDR